MFHIHSSQLTVSLQSNDRFSDCLSCWKHANSELFTGHCTCACWVLYMKYVTPSIFLCSALVTTEWHRSKCCSQQWFQCILMSHTKWCQYSCGIFSYFRSVHGSHSQSWAQNSNFFGTAARCNLDPSELQCQMSLRFSTVHSCNQAFSQPTNRGTTSIRFLQSWHASNRLSQ